MKPGRLFLIGIFFLSSHLSAQDTTFLDKIRVPPIIDTLFIDHDLNNWSFRIFTNYKDNRFKLFTQEERITYAPNNPMGVGFGIGTRKLLLDVAFNIKNKDKEPTDRFDFRASLMLNHHNFAYLLQTYHGYGVAGDIPEEFREDISAFTTALNYMYMFNSAEYSVTAMKSGLSKQKRAAVSMGLGGFIFYNRITSDSSIVSHSDLDLPNEELQIVNLPGFGGGLMVNFSGVVPIANNFYASLSLIPGIGLMYKNVETETGSYQPDKPMLYLADIASIIGYNANRYYINLSMGYSFVETSLDFGNRILYYTAKAKLAVGYKIKGKRTR